MKITVIGTGNVGTTIAADLSRKGHDIALLKTSSVINDAHFKQILSTKTIAVEDLDGSYKSKINILTTDFQEALKDAEVIILCIQTSYHSSLIKKIAPFLVDGQTIIVEPGYLSTCYFLQESVRNITIIEAESSPIDCRIVAPGEVRVFFKNTLNPFGVYPRCQKEKASAVLNELKYPFVLTKNVLEAALHNPNLIIHTVGAIFSIPRIEYSKGNYCMYKEVFTPHIWNIVEQLDAEKMAILARLGCESISYVTACRLRNSPDQTRNALEVFFEYANNSAPIGPSVPDSRYITEDVPQGLVLLESLGTVLNVSTKVCTALIDCASAALQRDFRHEGRSVETLGQFNIDAILEDSL